MGGAVSGRQHANHAVVLVGDEEIAVGVGRDSNGIVEDGLGGEPAIAGIGIAVAAGDGPDLAAQINHANAVVIRVGDVEVAGRIHRNRAGVIQLCQTGATAVAREARGAIARNRGDNAAGRDHAHALIASVRDIQVPLRVRGKAARQGEGGFQCGSAVATVMRAGEVAAVNSGEDLGGAGRGDFPDLRIVVLRHEEIARSIEGKSGRGVRCGELRELAARIDLAHFVVLEVGYEDVTLLIGGNGPRLVELRLKRGSAVALTALRAVAGDGRDGAIGG